MSVRNIDEPEGDASVEDGEAVTARLLADLFAEYDRRQLVYCVLRNFRSLPDRLESRDLDLRISSRDRSLNRGIIRALAERHGAIVYHHYKDERFDQFYLCRRVSHGEVVSLKLDFYELDVYGVRVLSTSDTLRTRVRHRSLFVASEVSQLLDKWLFIHLLGSQLPEKYHSEFRDIAIRNRSSLGDALSKVFGRRRGRELCARMCSEGFADLPRVGKARLAFILFKAACRSPLFHAWHVPAFFYYRARHFVRPKGEFISVSGPDGSGKTTVLNLATVQLGKLFGSRPENVGHFRPGIVPRIADIAKKAGVLSAVDENYGSPHRAKPSGSLGSLLRLGYYLVDYIAGYWKKIRPALVRRELVVYDRYCFDLIADPARSRISLPAWIRRIALALVPLPHTAFFVHVPSAVVRQRKQELSAEAIDSLNSAYQELVKDGRMSVLENGSTAEAAAAALVDEVIARRVRRLKLDGVVR